SVLGPDDLVRAIAAQDRVAITRADGVGPKLASRIILELRDKAGGIALGPAATAASSAAGQAANTDNGARGDAVSALVNLGYGRSEAFAAVMAADTKLGPGIGASALISQGLRTLGTEQ
ncbi:MAG: helix-hairpin-helix domain-containing protein, partial [Rhodospirillaceae bacterium]